jgi:hypothetical protein
MPKAVIVTFEHKSYTWDGRSWYGTNDHMMPPLGMIHKLNALIPKEAAPKLAPPRPKPRDA